MKRSLWMGAVIMAALGVVRMMQMRTKSSRTERVYRMGKRLLRNVRFAGMMNISPRYMTGFGRRMLRRMAR